MDYKFIFSSEAEKDIEEIIEWYLNLNKALSKRFYKELLNTKTKISRNPFAFQNRYNNIRIVFLSKFPYGIHYEVEGNIVFIYSVFHTSRKDRKFKKKI